MQRVFLLFRGAAAWWVFNIIYIAFAIFILHHQSKTIWACNILQWCCSAIVDEPYQLIQMGIPIGDRVRSSKLHPDMTLISCWTAKGYTGRGLDIQRPVLSILVWKWCSSLLKFELQQHCIFSWPYDSSCHNSNLSKILVPSPITWLAATSKEISVEKWWILQICHGKVYFQLHL